MRKPTAPHHICAAVREMLRTGHFPLQFPTSSAANDFLFNCYVYRSWLRAYAPESPDTLVVESVQFSYPKGTTTVTIRRKGGMVAQTIEEALNARYANPDI